MSAIWTRQPERGSATLLRLAVWLVLGLGRPVGRLLLYPISSYFLLFSGHARRASRRYLQRVLGRAPSLAESFRHYHTFAATILDRLCLLAGRHDGFELDVHGEAHLREAIRQGQGCLLVGAHLGSFEMLRALGVRQAGLTIKALMYSDNAQKFNRVAAALNPQLAADVIHVGTLDSLLGVQEHLARGHPLALLGDRVVGDAKRVRCDFLGAPADFSSAPWLLASALKVPVVLFFCLHRGDRQYAIHFEPMADRIALDRRQRDADIRHWAQRYADRLAHHCRRAPFNWFNFYDFWDEERRHAP
jgi:predicted LPLAT superfamily acyltransferase